MARARNIKPSIFKNETLGVADPLLMILFESLWCLADKSGRLEDRPLRIKAETFPYREGLNIDQMLFTLQDLGFIHRYLTVKDPSTNDNRIIQVVNFEKHQSPHHTEKESVLPAFTTGCHVTVKNPSQNALIPDSLLLIPDSLLLIPDSKSGDFSKITQPRTPESEKPDQKAGEPKTQTPESEEPKKQKPKSGTLKKLTEDFAITDDMRKWHEENTPFVQIETETEEFVNFWVHIATKNNRRTAKGWLLTWYKRMRELQERFEERKKLNGHGKPPINYQQQRNQQVIDERVAIDAVRKRVEERDTALSRQDAPDR